MRFEVILTEQAVQDLLDARDYIARSAPETAEIWYQSFLKALLALEDRPLARGLAPESAEFPFELRQFLFRTKSRLANRALFRVIESQVVVLAIRRPGQPLISPRRQ